EPSLVTRAAFFCALAAPVLRRMMTAFSMSPPASVRAFLQSIMGAPVRSRSSLTCAAVMLFTVVVLIIVVGPWSLVLGCWQNLNQQLSLQNFTRAYSLLARALTF